MDIEKHITQLSKKYSNPERAYFLLESIVESSPGTLKCEKLVRRLNFVSEYSLKEKGNELHALSAFDEFYYNDGECNVDCSFDNREELEKVMVNIRGEI
jgi:hypothetical protein